MVDGYRLQDHAGRRIFGAANYRQRRTQHEPRSEHTCEASHSLPQSFRFCLGDSRFLFAELGPQIRLFARPGFRVSLFRQRGDLRRELVGVAHRNLGFTYVGLPGIDRHRQSDTGTDDADRNRGEFQFADHQTP